MKMTRTKVGDVVALQKWDLNFYYWSRNKKAPFNFGEERLFVVFLCLTKRNGMSLKEEKKGHLYIAPTAIIVVPIKSKP